MHEPRLSTCCSYHLLLVSSSGGVLLDLLALRPWWEQHRTAWAVVKAEDTQSALLGQCVHWVKERQGNRPYGAIFGFFEALRILCREKPDLMVSAGSGVAVGFFLAARLLGIPAFWLETFNFICAPGLSSRICSRLSSEVLVQRPSLLEVHPHAVLLGELY